MLTEVSRLRTAVFGLIFLAAGSLLAFATAGTLEQDKLRFDQETNPVRKAKEFQKLGDDQMAELARQVGQENFDGALQTLTNYRDETRIAFDGLHGSGIDAEKHSDGFKQLENALRKSIWQMERTLPGIPEEHRAAFSGLLNELIDIQTQLVHMLFPREAGSGKPKG
jgi:hypothetical protein